MDTYLNIGYDNPIVRNVRFFYGYRCLTASSGDSTNLDVWDCQFQQVDEAIEVTEGSVALHNVLIVEANSDYPVWLDDIGDFMAEQVTYADGFAEAMASLSSGSSHLTNCLSGSTSIYGGWYYAATNGNTAIATTTPIFANAGNANYYLAPGSPYRNLGTTNISPDLLAEIQDMTTYAPQDGGWPDTNAPDFGYHYPTNEDSTYTGVPDWWIWQWFGNYNENGTTLDGQGNTLLYDYQNGLDPNTISFTVRLGNQHSIPRMPPGLISYWVGSPATKR